MPGGGDFWRRTLRAKGRPMTLRRQTGVNPNVYSDVTVNGFQAMYRPEQLVGEIRQGDAQVRITNDEIEAAVWPGPPRARDVMVIDSRTWTVQGATPLHDGPVLVAHMIWVRGGQ